MLREAGEESILEALVVNKYLGRDEYLDISTNPNKLVMHHFFHLTSPKGIPDTWQHYELHQGDGSSGPIMFEFYRLQLGEAADELVYYFSAMLEWMPDIKIVE